MGINPRLWQIGGLLVTAVLVFLWCTGWNESDLALELKQPTEVAVKSRLDSSAISPADPTHRVNQEKSASCPDLPVTEGMKRTRKGDCIPN